MSDKSDTPRTDNAYKYGHVSREFARTLERELNEAKKALENSKAYKRVMKQDNARMKAEIQGLKNKWDCAVEIAAKSEAECDWLRSQIAELKAIINQPNQ